VYRLASRELTTMESLRKGEQMRGAASLLVEVVIL